MNEKDRLLPSRRACQQYLTQYDPSLRLGACLGKGGAGVVYELIGTPTPQVVKIVDTGYMAGTRGNRVENKEARRKCVKYMQREKDVMQRFSSCEHVMPLLDFYTCRSSPLDDPGGDSVVALFVMPRMCNLADYLKEGNPLTESDVLQLGLDMAEVLQVFCPERIVHRDLKTGNIFVVRRNGRLRFVLGDFGISRRIEHLGEEQITRIGSNYYIAPEIRYGETLQYLNSDIYSLGVTLFFVMTNYYPEPKKEPGSRQSFLPQWHNVLEEFVPILEKALQIDPAYRYHDPRQLIQDLNGLRLIRRGNVVSNPHIMATKEALCHGKLEDALHNAIEGCRKKESGCERLLAYCLYQVQPDHPKIMELLDEAFCDDDVVGILIRGMVLASRGQLLEAGQDIREAAEHQKDCVPAWYYYGRFLYDGSCPGIERDPRRGLLYLQKAAERNFYPALRVLKRLRGYYPGLALPDELEELLKREYRRDDPMEKADIVKFL